MKIQHLVEYALFSMLGWFVRLWPLGTVRRMGAAFSGFIFALGFRKDVTLDNLRRAYPEKSVPELEALARNSYRSIGMALFEFLWFPCFSPERIRQEVQIENIETIREVHRRGKGVIFLTAHFGNWELIAQGMSLSLGVPISVIAKPQANLLVDTKINGWREALGSKFVPMGIAVREILRTLHSGGIVGIVADQSAPKESVAVKFFGRNVPTYEGPAVFSLKTGAPMMIGFTVRQSDGSYRAHFEEVPTSDLKEYNDDNVKELTRRHVEMTEQFIRRYPDHWMWMHKRWKHALESDTLA